MFGSRSLASINLPSPHADCSVMRTMGGFIGSRQNMLSVFSGVDDGCGTVAFSGGMIGVFSFW